MALRRSSKLQPPPTKPTQPHSTTRPSGVPRQPLIEISARHRLEPFRQGQLDSLCSLYAIINGLRLASADFAPITLGESRELFASGIAFLNRKKGLYDAITEGLYVRRQLALARHLAKLASSPRRRFLIERADSNLKTIDDIFCWIASSIFEGRPVVLPLMDHLDHLTIVGGLSDKLLLLFDSGGLQHVRRSSCGLRDRLHSIPVNGLMRIVTGGSDKSSHDDCSRRLYEATATRRRVLTLGASRSIVR